MTDRHHGSATFPFGILLLGCVLLLPTLTFPMQTDHATFLRGGLTLLEGGTLYVDFIDVKPPLIYGLFGLSGSVAGVHPISVRLLDILWQTATIGMMLILLRSVRFDRMTQLWSVVTYAMLYVTLHFSQTAQVESFIGLPLAFILYLITQPSSWRRDVGIGSAIAVVILLKYTLGLVAVACVLYEVTTVKSLRTSVFTSIRWAAYSVVAIVLLSLPFAVQPGFWDGWVTVMAYIKSYSAYPPYDTDLIRAGLKATGRYAGDNVSILITAAAIGGIFGLVRRQLTEAQRSVLSLALIILVALLATVALERRFPPYHFSRIYLPLAILAGSAMGPAWTALRARIGSHSMLTRVALVLAASVGIALSPLPRYTTIAVVAARSIADPGIYDRYLTRQDPDAVDWVAIRSLESSLLQRVKPTQRLMFMSVTASSITPFIPSTDPSVFCDSHLYFGVGVPESWRLQALEEFRRADWLAVDTADIHRLVNLHDRSSFASLQADADFRTTLDASFELDTAVHSYRIYRRRVGNP